MKKNLVIHPFLFAVFPVVSLFSHNLGEAVFSDTIFPLTIALSFAAVFMFALSIILKNARKAAALTSCFLIFFFSYGHFCEIVKNVHFYAGNISMGYNKIFFLPYLSILLFSFYRIWRSRGDFNTATKLLNIMASFLVIISLINIGTYFLKSSKASKTRCTEFQSHQSGNSLSVGLNPSLFPDIYYIIPDAYVSFSTLRDIYGYSNSEFVDYLEKKGFYIASESRCNYFNTKLSLASSLNMRYLNYLSDTPSAELNDAAVLYRMIENNKVVEFLKSRGYKFINGGSAETPYTKYNRHADINLIVSRWDEFSGLFIQTTMLKPFLGQLLRNLGRERILGSFSKLAETVKLEGPKFVFAHISCPHAPYLFDARGNLVSGEDFKLEGYTENTDKKYLEQVIFVSKKLKALIDEILIKSKNPPIIVIQADQGPGSFYAAPAGIAPDQAWRQDFRDISDIVLQERFRVLSALYFPSGGDSVLYKSITAVNIFRALFNYYFNAGYELLEDKSYYSTDQDLYKFIDVTERVDYN